MTAALDGWVRAAANHIADPRLLRRDTDFPGIVLHANYLRHGEKRRGGRGGKKTNHLR